MLGEPRSRRIRKSLLEQIHKRLKPGDTLYEEARDRMEEAEDRFCKALSAVNNRVYGGKLKLTGD